LSEAALDMPLVSIV